MTTESTSNCIDRPPSSLPGKSLNRDDRHSTTNERRWVRVGKQNPCPVCKLGKWPCQVAFDGDRLAFVQCGRVASDRQASDGTTWLHYDLTGDQAAVVSDDWIRRAASTGTVREPKNWSAHLRHCFRRDGGRRPELAERLGVDASSLADLSVGWDNVREAWTWGERDGSGVCIGIGNRSKWGGKWNYGQRGLIYPDRWDRGGPVLLVEGLSDTATVYGLDLTVIGRPNNKLGVEQLAELLDGLDASREIIVVGERDEKPDGDFPGREGAIQTAEQLAASLERPVSWCFPPGDAKDVRAWRNAGGDGAQLLDGLRQTLTVVSPPADLPILEVPQDERPVIDLDEYRQQMATRRLEAWERGGVYLDRSSTGAGKTHADIVLAERAAQAGQRSLVVLPTHANCREVVEDLASLTNGGINAAAYPKRNTDPKDGDGLVNCQNSWADKVESLGLPVLLTACVSCDDRGTCQQHGYLGQLATAKEATVAVATHARASCDGTNLANGRDLILVHEDPRSILVPQTSVERKDLVLAADLVNHILSDPRELDRLDGRDEIDDWLRQLVTWLDQVSGLTGSANETVRLPVIGPRPKGVENQVYQAMKRRDCWTGGWRGILAAASGEATGWVVVNQVLGRGGERRAVRGVLVTWSNELPPGQTVIIGDATSTADDLTRLVKRQVQDITPDGRLALVQRTVQVPRDITRQTSLATVGKILRGILEQHPDRQRVGVIVHRPHKAAVQGIDRVVKVAYFGSGDDRSSNEWHRDCDLVLVLGTPRVGPDAVRAELLRTGKLEAAQLDDQAAGWRKYQWRGQDERGQPVLVTGRGYSHPDWQAAFVSLTRSNMVQAVGRGRGILAEGIPVVVVSTEPLGLPVSDGDRPWLNDGQTAVLDAVRRLAGESAQNPTRDYVGKGADSRPAAVQLVKMAEVLEATGLKRRLVNKHVLVLERLGLVIRDGKRGIRPVVQEIEPDSGLTGDQAENDRTSEPETGVSVQVRPEYRPPNRGHPGANAAVYQTGPSRIVLSGIPPT